MINTLSRMIRTGILTEAIPAPAAPSRAVDDLQNELNSIIGRALCIRQVDAGSCNGCELEIQALNNPYYNLEGTGIKFVASPRHADLLLVTGPVSVNMEEALKRTLDAVPDPEAGDCSGRLRCLRRSVWKKLRKPGCRLKCHPRPLHGYGLPAQSRCDHGGNIAGCSLGTGVSRAKRERD